MIENAGRLTNQTRAVGLVGQRAKLNNSPFLQNKIGSLQLIKCISIEAVRTMEENLSLRVKPSYFCATADIRLKSSRNQRKCGFQAEAAKKSRLEGGLILKRLKRTR
jgi:hypothetical protein